MTASDHPRLLHHEFERSARRVPDKIWMPVAPPLPFTFVGLVEKGTPKPQAFLARGDELLVVSQGDMLDNGAYRIDAVTPTQIVFTHVPTNTKQIISLSGGAS